MNYVGKLAKMGSVGEETKYYAVSEGKFRLIVSLRVEWLCETYILGSLGTMD